MYVAHIVLGDPNVSIDIFMNCGVGATTVRRAAWRSLQHSKPHRQLVRPTAVVVDGFPECVGMRIWRDRRWRSTRSRYHVDGLGGRSTVSLDICVRGFLCETEFPGSAGGAAYVRIQLQVDPIHYCRAPCFSLQEEEDPSQSGLPPPNWHLPNRARVCSAPESCCPRLLSFLLP